MSWVIAKPGETIESLLKRFKKAVENSGILADLKRHEFFEKPSIKRKRKQDVARKRAIKKFKKTARQQDKKANNKNFKWNKDHTKKIMLSPPKKYNLRDNTNDTKDGSDQRSNASRSNQRRGTRYGSNQRSNTRNDYVKNNNPNKNSVRQNHTKKSNYTKRDKS